MMEAADYTVRITLTGNVSFAEMERDSRITKADAIANALGTFPDSMWAQIEAEGFTIECEAEKQ